jgi:hypothetical protein
VRRPSNARENGDEHVDEQDVDEQEVADEHNRHRVDAQGAVERERRIERVIGTVRVGVRLHDGSVHKDA